MSLKRDVGLIITTAMIVSGLFIINDSDYIYETNLSPSKIIKVDDKTEIRIIEGTKYKCTVINNK
jgi:hypothetical protein